jgi:hypothetical protein
MLRLQFLTQRSLFATGTGTGSGFGGLAPLCAASRRPLPCRHVPTAACLVGPGSLSSWLLNAATLLLLSDHPLLDEFSDFAGQGRETRRFHVDSVEH